jgi:microsomal epoxide hydrolase
MAITVARKWPEESDLMNDLIEPFQLSVPEAQLADLRNRLSHTRWPERETVTDTSQGPKLQKIQALAAYWRDQYDWRRCEAMLNGFGQQRTLLDGLGIHFLHARSPEANALPLVLTHGWPGSVLEFHKMIGPLTDPAAHGGERRDAFHLVVPSLPGFGFSDKPSGPGWGVSRIADAWITLMGRLGYDRWGAHGGDWGAAVTTAIGRKAPPGCVGMHLNFVMYQPTPEEIADATPHEQAMLASMRTYQDTLSGYAKLQGTRPQTIGYSLADSPVGLASWIYALFQDVSDSGGDAESVFTRDEMLDDIMLYWLPDAGASSARLYWEARSSPSGPPSEPMQTPTAVSMFPKELVRISRRWAEARFARLIRFNELEAGGHFAALEQPGPLTDEIRVAFRGLRT